MKTTQLISDYLATHGYRFGKKINGQYAARLPNSRIGIILEPTLIKLKAVVDADMAGRSITMAGGRVVCQENR